MRIDFFARGGLCAALTALLLAACASAPEPSEPPPPRPARESIQRFALEGRAVIRTPQNAENARILWEHLPDADALAFASPLGNIVAELNRDAYGARWTTASGERYEARSADLLLARLTDIPVPLDALSLWVCGRVRPGATVVRRDALGRLLEAQDGGWAIGIVEYESPDVNAMPRVVEAVHGQVRIRFAIEAWKL